MRFVSREVSETLSGHPNAHANFGLVFNKWLIFEERNGIAEPVVKQNRQPLITQYEKSRKKTIELLKQRHIRQASYCQAMVQAGWHSFIIHAELTAPFVSGLGMAHPTETGLVLDHTTGVPYIPAASQKGVLRLAHMINSLLDENGEWRELDDLLALGLVKQEENKKTKETEDRWHEDTASQTLFGCGGDKNALAGRVVVLDAYPLTSPELDEEILNPHYGDYYQQKLDRNGEQRCPTEDQKPVPIKFLVVKKRTQFAFRLLLRHPLAKAPEADTEKLTILIEKNLRRALTEEGMGAKTSLGFGRFAIITTGEPSCVIDWQRQNEEEEERRKYPWRPIVRKIEAAADWGQLKQLLESRDFQEYQRTREVGQAVRAVAAAIRKDKPKKWAPERDEFLAEWLTLSGMTWQSAATAATPATDLAFSPEVQAAVDRINALADWGAFKNARIDPADLPREALRALCERMKKDWGCAEKKARKDKQEAFKTVKKLLVSA